jgi:hypothetical protein
MINGIMGLPHKGESVPKTTNSDKWIQKFTGSSNAKNSKGLLINQVKE